MCRRWKCVAFRSYTKGSNISWHYHQISRRKVLLNIVHPSCPLALNQLWRRHKCHGGLKYFEDLFVGTFGVVVYPSPCLLWWPFPQTWLIFLLFSQGKTASSTFQVPVWSFGMQLETKGSWEFLKSKCPLIFEAFSADDKLFEIKVNIH